MEETMPNKMTPKDKIPRKPIAKAKGNSNREVTKKDRKSPPEFVAHKRNMDSPLGSDFEDDGDEFSDKDLEEAQNRSFGRKRPDFVNLKSDEKNLKPSEKEKEDREIHPAHDKDAGQYSLKEYKDWEEANMDKLLEVKAHAVSCLRPGKCAKANPERPKWQSHWYRFILATSAV